MFPLFLVLISFGQIVSSVTIALQILETFYLFTIPSRSNLMLVVSPLNILFVLFSFQVFTGDVGLLCDLFLISSIPTISSATLIHSILLPFKHTLLFPIKHSLITSYKRILKIALTGSILVEPPFPIQSLLTLTFCLNRISLYGK